MKSTSPTLRSIERLVGVYEGSRPGRTYIALGGMHGNEPAGIEAVHSVLTRLHEDRIDLAGTLMGVIGNRAALAVERRFIERDLNRGWEPTDCRRVLAARGPQSPEDIEQRELLELFGPLEAKSDRPLCFLDLHSTSGPAAPFSIIPDVARNRALALALPIPTVLGLEEILEGVMFGYLIDRGHMGVAVEGGQHRGPQTAARLEAVVWLTLLAARALEPDQVPDLDVHRERLSSAVTGLPRAVRIIHRQGVDDGEPFEMVPGFDNFSPIRKGQTIAHGRRGPLHATEDGIVMLPRYQGQGNDGFFLATEVSRQWLAMSAAARRTNMERFLSLWPGLEWTSSEPDRARYQGGPASRPMLRALRLLGFHGCRRRAGGLEFFRRRP